VKPTLLVFGRQGQVARALAASGAAYAFEFAGHDRLDLAQASPDIAGMIAAVRPAAVINASAYNAVDAAETDAITCNRLNRDAPAAMAAACRAADIPFVHFSTDYVFDGAKGAPYAETDPRGPLNVYGRAKADGEAAIEALIADGARAATIRTCWVFAPGGGGFLAAMLRAAAEGREATVVADQWGTPTPAVACADAALILIGALLDRDAAALGIFHAAGRDGLSRADLAEAIMARLPARTGVRRVCAADYPSAARRPRDTRLSSGRLEAAFDWRSPELDAALDACLSEVRSPPP
jgi:dTDP-4-dehydrorhamnose reductase